MAGRYYCLFCIYETKSFFLNENRCGIISNNCFCGWQYAGNILAFQSNLLMYDHLSQPTSERSLPLCMQTLLKRATEYTKANMYILILVTQTV